MTYCPLPFVHSCSTIKGKARPCSRFSDKKYVGKKLPMDFFNTDLQDIRDLMLENKKVEGCSKCYLEESIGSISYRQRNIEKFGIIKEPNLTYLEISLDTLCNMACVMCDANFSTLWNDYIDVINYDNKFEDLKKQVYSPVIHDYTDEQLKKVTRLKLLGGEPFLTVRNIDFLEKLNLSELTLDIATNVSIIPNKKWQALLEKCNKVNVILSIDGIGQVAEFSRFGTVWKDIEKNIEWYCRSFRRKNRKVTVNSSIHAFNVFYYNELVNFLDNCDIDECDPYNLVQWPRYLDVKILPIRTKYKLIDKLIDSKVKNYLEKTVNYKDEHNLHLFLEYTKRLQNRQHFKFVDLIIEECEKDILF